MSEKFGATLRMALRKSSCGLLLGLFLGIPAAVLAEDSERQTLNPSSAYPEGPLVVGDTLFYAEMGNDRVMRWDGKRNAVVWSEKGCGPTSVARSGAADLIVLCHRAEHLVRISIDGRTLETIDADRRGRRFSNPNASVNDRKGGVYFSSSGVFGPGAKAEGAVLYLDPSGKLHRVAEGIHYANGVAVSPDGTRLYVSEHLSRRILTYRIGENGSLSDKAVFVSLDDLLEAQPDRSWEVGPDGLAVDRNGDVFAAEYGAGHFLVLSKDGALLATVEVPDPFITGVALSPDESRIFVTAPTRRMIPNNGRVYSIANPLLSRD